VTDYIFHAPIDPIVAWHQYLDSLPWQKGSLDQAGNAAFLRAGSLGISEQVAFDEVTRRITDAGDHVRVAKLRTQLVSAYRLTHHSCTTGGWTSSYSPAPKWPKPDLDLIRQIVAGGPGLYDLDEASPWRFEGSESHVEEIIDTLFPGNPLLCIGFRKHSFGTMRRQDWRNLLAIRSLIVPNPMLSVQGKTQAGKFSQHTLEATGRRVYLIVEFDFAADEFATVGLTLTDASAALHLHLASLMPLACVTSSGGKSLHGWYRVFNLSELQQRAFFATAVRLGADWKLWCPSQFTRLPDGEREDGNRQRCFYLNPKNCISL
jgi:hypothetical protein